MLFNKRDLDTKQRFSIRKLTIGTCSVLLSTLFLGIGTNEVVHADTLPNNVQEQNAQTNKNDAQKDEVIDASQVQDSKIEGSNQAQKVLQIQKRLQIRMQSKSLMKLRRMM